MSPWAGPTLAFAGIAAFAAAAGLAGAVRSWAARRRILDVPNERSSHTVPTPRVGGLAIVGVTVIGIGIAGALGVLAIESSLAWAVTGSILVAGVSFLDDIGELIPPVRLAAHVAAALPVVIVCKGLPAAVIPGVGTVRLGWAGAVLAVVWVVGLTNAFNFMDGIDGIAGGQALVAGLGWAALAGAPAVRFAGVMLAASSAGFLVHNWAPARLFMGDVGSAFLGYWLAVLPLVAARGDGRSLVLGAVFVWPFVFDTTFTLLRRLRRRENVFAAHRSHLYQRLVIAGWPHRSVSGLYLALAVLGVASAGAWRAGRVAAWVVAAAIGAAAAGLWALVVWRERTSSPHPPTEVKAVDNGSDMPGP